MRRSRLLWPILVIVTAAVVYLVRDDLAEPRQTAPKRTYVDLRSPGMELRAGPTTSTATPLPPPPLKSDSGNSARPTGR